MSNSSSLTEIASTISANAQLIEEFLNFNGLPQPSFALDGPPGFPVPPSAAHIYQAHDLLLDAARKLTDLVRGPVDSLFEVAARFHDSANLRAVYKFDIAAKVPIDGEKSYQEIADAIGVDEDRTHRVLRFAMTNGLFKETRPGFVSHTAMSALMANETIGIKDMVGHATDDAFPASSKLVESMENFPQPKNRLVETPFALAFNTEEPFFDYLAKHPTRQSRFHAAMRTMNFSGPFSGEAVARGYDWSEYSSGTLVDVGGSSGHTTLKIADSSSISNLIVQDFSAEEVTNSEKNLPEKYRGRVRFQQHDFFTPQPIKDADIYFIRFIFHDWPDEECIEILRNLVPALKNGAKILINEIVLPEPNTVLSHIEKFLLTCDMHLLTLIGSRERDLGAWKRLFTTADARFKLIGAKRPQESMLSIIEVRFEDLPN